jgi:protein phosphatase 1L
VNTIAVVNVVLSTDDAYKSTDSEFLESDSTQNQCGSTASTAVLVSDHLFVANVGDSRAIICRGGNGNQEFTLLALQSPCCF